jgi:hypothetical protein
VKVVDIEAVKASRAAWTRPVSPWAGLAMRLPG